ncbi:hypothetical protein RND81_13G065400 [Saponaria officinalis]|uniref:Uncharacterized protein n=1 Tax=Saponaria officinalis TaxID=3572 RepID=A0AAW1H359_SAPOF
MVFNISSCTSQNSTSIITSNIDQPSQSPPPPPFIAGDRALDRHNPIVTDEKRSGTGTNQVLQQKSVIKNTTLAKTSNNTKNTTAVKTISTKSLTSANYNNDGKHHKEVGRKSFSRTSDLIMKAGVCKISKAGVDYINPQESSSRYLLDDTSFSDVFSDNSSTSLTSSSKNGEVDNIDASSKLSHFKPPSSSSSGSSDQVVVLRVSLHCRGCERKLKRHLSSMPGFLLSYLSIPLDGLP